MRFTLMRNLIGKRVEVVEWVNIGSRLGPRQTCFIWIGILREIEENMIGVEIEKVRMGAKLISEDEETAWFNITASTFSHIKEIKGL